VLFVVEFPVLTTVAAAESNLWAVVPVDDVDDDTQCIIEEKLSKNGKKSVVTKSPQTLRSTWRGHTNENFFLVKLYDT
jgi:hypothetical protein